MSKRSWANALVCLLEVTLNLGPVQAGPSFYGDHQRGWFWYERYVDPPEPARKPSEPPSPSSAPRDNTPEPLSAAWFRSELGRFRDQAIDHPTPERIRAFLYLQRVMMDKASRFTDESRKVILQDPFLDENNRRPMATFAVNEANRQSGVATEQSLKAIAKKAALLFFFRSDCHYCSIEVPLLKAMASHFGFSIFPVSLDGRGLPGNPFPDYRVDQGQAQRLGVASTPALYLVIPPNDLRPIGQGTLSMEELIQRILTQSEAAGLIDHKALDQTRGITTQPELIPTGPTENLPPGGPDDAWLKRLQTAALPLPRTQ